jgi:N-acetylglucosamine kinase-like BadF-type ATPase
VKTHVIIDCGATSAKIAVIRKHESLSTDTKEVKQVDYHKIQGFNPNHHDWLTFHDRIQSLFVLQAVKADSLVFYGTGLTSGDLMKRMTSMLSRACRLSEEDILVFSDLLACAHAVYDDRPVIIAILGTGSNVGYYDGSSLTRRTPSLGYLLGDEGSGVDIGKAMLKAFCYGQLPDEVATELREQCKLSLDLILNRTYNQNDLRSLASEAAPFAHTYHHFESIQSIVNQSLERFIDSRLIPELNERPEVRNLFLFGSVAIAFESQLKDLMNKRHAIQVQVVSDHLRLLVEGQ